MLYIHFPQIKTKRRNYKLYMIEPDTSGLHYSEDVDVLVALRNSISDEMLRDFNRANVVSKSVPSLDTFTRERQFADEMVDILNMLSPYAQNRIRAELAGSPDWRNIPIPSRHKKPQANNPNEEDSD